MVQPARLKEFTQTSALTAAQLLGTALCGLGTTIFLARRLGPTGQGAYSVCYGLAILTMLLFDFGIGAATTYYVSRRTYGAATAAQQNLLLGLAVGGGAMLVVGGVLRVGHAQLLPGIDALSILLTLATIPPLIGTSYLTCVLQGAEDFRRYNALSLVPHLARFALTLAALGLGAGLHGALAAALVAHLLAFVAAVGLLRSHGLRAAAPWRLDRIYARAVAGYGVKAYAANALTQLNYRADVFLMNAFLDAGVVGIYAVAVGIGERLWILSYAVGTIILPRIAALAGNETERQALTPRVARHVLWLAAMAALVLAWIAPWLIDILFGPAYAPAVRALRCLLPGLVMFNISRVLGNDIAGRGRPDVNATLSGGVALANILTNLWAIPHHGMLGASVVASASYTLDALLKMLIYVKLTGVPWTQLMFLQRRDLTALARLWPRRAGVG